MLSTSRLKIAISHMSARGALMNCSRPSVCAPAIARNASVATTVTTTQATLENTMPVYTGTIA